MKAPDKISIYYTEGLNAKGEMAVVLNIGSDFRAAVLNPDGSFKEWLGLKCRHDESPIRRAQNYLYPLPGCSPYAKRQKREWI